MLTFLLAILFGVCLERLGLLYYVFRRRDVETAVALATILAIAVVGLALSVPELPWKSGMLSVVSGISLGCLAGLWTRRQNVAAIQLPILAVLFAIGIYPFAGETVRRFMEDAGIEEAQFGNVSLKRNRFMQRTHAEPVVRFDKLGKRSRNKPDELTGSDIFVHLTEHLTGTIARDIGYLNLALQDLEEHREISRVFNSTIAPFLKSTVARVAECISEVHPYRDLGYDFRNIAFFLSRAYALLLVREKVNSAAALDFLGRFNDSIGSIEKVDLGSRARSCRRVDQSEVSVDILSSFVKHSKEFPHGNIALALLFQLGGDAESSERILSDWVSEFEEKEVSPGVRFPVLVRALNFLSFLKDNRSAEDQLKVKRKYIEILEDYWKHLGNLDKDRLPATPQCPEGHSNDSRFQTLNAVIHYEKNNFIRIVEDAEQMTKDEQKLVGSRIRDYAHGIWEYAHSPCNRYLGDSKLVAYVNATMIHSYSIAHRWLCDNSEKDGLNEYDCNRKSVEHILQLASAQIDLFEVSPDYFLPLRKEIQLDVEEMHIFENEGK